MKKVLMILSFLMMMSLSIAQTKPLNRETVMSELAESITSHFGLTLTVNLEEGTSTVEMTNANQLINLAQTDEQKIAYKYQVSQLEILREAESFLDVLDASSGRFNITSHQVIVREKEEIHYFIFTF